MSALPERIHGSVATPSDGFNKEGDLLLVIEEFVKSPLLAPTVVGACTRSLQYELTTVLSFLAGRSGDGCASIDELAPRRLEDITDLYTSSL